MNTAVFPPEASTFPGGVFLAKFGEIVKLDLFTTRFVSSVLGMPRTSTLYRRICQILESARIRVARSVNTQQVVANWLIGREIVEEEQKGKRRAVYGNKLIESLAGRLRKEFGDGYSVQNLRYMR